MSGDPTWDIRDLGQVLRRWKRFLIWNVISVTVGALILSLVLPTWYTASTTLLPPQEDAAGFDVSTMLRGLTIPGVRIPTQVSPAEVFVAVLSSRTLLTRLDQEFDFRRLYRRAKLEDAIKEFRRHLSAQIGEDGLIILRVEDRDRERAARMTNRLVELLDEFNRETRSSRGKRARIFIEKRLADTRIALSFAEDSLKRFQLRNKSLIMRPEEAGTSELAARLLAERLDLQMRLAMTSSFASSASPEMQRLRLRSLELDRQIGRLPDLGLGMARYYRDVKVQEQVFTLLMAQYEEAKIQEAKDVATVEVLDRAIPPERKSRPRRSVIVLLGFGLSLVLGVGYVLTTEYLRRVQQPA